MPFISWSEILTALPFVIMGCIYALAFSSRETAIRTISPSLLKPGTRVATRGGVIGCIARITTATIILELYDGTLIEIEPSAITAILR